MSKVGLWDEVDVGIGYTPSPLDQQKRVNKAHFDWQRPQPKQKPRPQVLDAEALHRKAFKKATR